MYRKAQQDLPLVYHWGFDMDGSIGKEWRDSFLASCTAANLCPTPQSPYDGLSVGGLLNKLEKLHIHTFCDMILQTTTLDVGACPNPFSDRAEQCFEQCSRI